MQWSDKAIVLSIKKYGETSAIVTLLTEHMGLTSGLVKGISSPKLRGIYQQGNITQVTWKARLPEHLGFISGELLESSVMILLTDSHRLAALSSITAVVAHCLPERECETQIYHHLYQFITLLKTDQPWHIAYIKLELLLLAALGFGLDLTECAATGVTDNLFYVSPKTGKAVSATAGEPYKDKLLTLPSFLKTDISASLEADIKHGFRLTGYFLEKWNFIPRNMKLPAARSRLEELISA